MASSSRADRIPLTGADCFLRAFDAETRALSGSSHLSQLVLRLGAGLDVAAFEQALAAATADSPILRAPIRRRLGVGPPSFDLRERAAGPPPIFERHAGGAEGDARARPRPLPELFFERLNGRHSLRRGEHLRFDLVEYDAGEIRADLAMTWSHMLLDGSGSEQFVERLAQGWPEPTGALPAAGSAAPLLPERRFVDTANLAREWLDQMNGFGERPPRSLSGPATRRPQALRYEVLSLDAERSARVRERAREYAGFLTPVVFYLAATIRAHHAVFQARGEVPSSYVIPLPVNLRKKGHEGPIFQTQISMLWFQVVPDVVDDFGALVRSIKEQRLEIIKGGAIERSAAALDFIRLMPARQYARLARSTFRGEVASFLFAFTDAFLPRCDDFFGAPLVNGFHAPSVTPSPGSSAIMSLRDGCLNVAHVYQRGVLDEDERAVFRARLLADLEGTDS